MKDIDITQNLNEMNMDQKAQKEILIPPSFMNHPEKPGTIIPFIKEIKYSPNSGLIYSDKSQIRFLINSTGFLDPYGIYLKFKLQNDSPFPIFIDKSYHNLIDRFQVNTNGNIIEEYSEFDIINDILFDQSLKEETLETLRPFGFYSKSPDIILPEGGTFATTEGEINILKASTNEPLIVQKGKPAIYYSSKTREILIPVMSKVFGFGVDFNYYRFIPLERFPNLEINFSLNFEAIRLAMSNLEDIFYKYTPEEMRTNIRNSIKIKDVCLVTRQLYFDSQMLSSIRSNMSGDLVFDFVMTQILHKKSETKEALIKDHYESFNIPRVSIRRFNMAFYSDKSINLQYPNFATSKYNRYNGCLKFLQLKVGDENYPNQPLEGDSSNICGEVNNFSFWNNYLQTLSKGLGNFSNSLVTPFTFSLNSDLHSDLIDMHLNLKNIYTENEVKKMNNKKIDAGNFLLNEGAVVDPRYYMLNYYKNYVANYSWKSYGRCIYQINLESIPFSCGSFRCGIDTRYNRAMTLTYKFQLYDERERQNYLYEADLAQRNTITYYMIDFDYTLRISPNGQITKEF